MKTHIGLLLTYKIKVGIQILLMIYVAVVIPMPTSDKLPVIYVASDSSKSQHHVFQAHVFF